ncbi:hypothetical protein A3C23_02315 [Candidatus Roizmanbacteria bacterium RIFCSPHIGHO2_02_FULL_37_13b]|uniref:Cohesin domain-containing protein n=1 Tax=Candidatus Roizmanbacteria bacterium RIFCSPLOWO2_02_FULL_36_11 TaxID=1802071 RepID=A0A1F7JJ21_9BACT|nr:MAG: hypothetical protein A3C23_02315 [Candidatus Roizmanbacteria bacterium RIFCSPHIGHO2_02_FULL_37_13b]OGK55601.1 MAG: hypothetical protein A3H78_01460 [Candidatus Roizmanbacteria bacterium RIFCSPLOWO2_02_FULL_36_11]
MELKKISASLRRQKIFLYAIFFFLVLFTVLIVASIEQIKQQSLNPTSYGMIAKTFDKQSVNFPAIIKLDTSEKTTSVNQTFKVDVYVDAGQYEILSSDVRLQYDKSSIEPLSAEDGGFMTLVYSDLYSKPGNIYLASVVEEAKDYRTGKGKVATITFKAIKQGKSKISVICIPGVTADDSNISKNDINATDVIDCRKNYVVPVNVKTDTSSPDESPNASCYADGFRWGRLVHAFGGTPCYDGATFTCHGNTQNDNRTISRQVPTGRGGCLSEADWKKEAVTICRCVPEPETGFDCVYKKLNLSPKQFTGEFISCSKLGRSTSSCYYEAEITCNNDKVYQVSMNYCAAKKSDKGGWDWDFAANLICCKSVGKPACREFKFDEYSICKAYCLERGFTCVSGGTRDLKCDDPKC